MKVNPERTRRYLKRTLARPEKSITLSFREMEAHQERQNAWHRSQEGTPPYSVEWMERVAAYCKAKGLRYDITVSENPSDMSKTISWEPQDV